MSDFEDDFEDDEISDDDEYEREMFGALFPVLDRTYMLREMFAYINDEELLESLPPEIGVKVKHLAERFDDLYQTLGLLLLDDDGVTH